MADLDLADLLDSWELHLRAERKAPATVRLYGTGVRLYLAWCDRQGRPAELDRGAVAGWIAALLDGGAEPATARSRFLAVRRFTSWLVAEGELTADPLAGLRTPKVDVKVTRVLTADQLRALVAACQGTGFLARRDEAVIRLMAETGLRAGELVDLEVEDLDVRGGLAVVRRGKGGRGRTVPFTAQTARSLDRYVRLRRTHPLAHTAALWLGDRGHGFGYDALAKMLKARAAAAGIPRFHAHVLRHTAASRWLAAGGSEGGLMTVAGWRRRDMIERYAASTAAERAAAEARRLALGDF